MVNRPAEKQVIHHRSSRQIRPIINSIIFLLAANLVAKGALGLGHYNPNVIPNIPGNIQGSVYLSVNNPNEHNWNTHNAMPIPYTAQHTAHGNWFPVQNSVPYSLYGSTTQKSRPVNQQQIINIREPLYDDSSDSFQDDGPQQQVIINKSKNFDLDTAASNDNQVNETVESVSIKSDTHNTDEENEEQIEMEGETTTAFPIPPDVEVLPGNFTGRQNVPTTAPPTTAPQMTTRPTTTTMPTTTTTATTTTATTAATTAMTPTTLNPNNATNNTGPGYGYGPSRGNENVTFTTPGPLEQSNMTAMQNMSTLQPPPLSNNTNTTINPVYSAPNHPPYTDYGPSNGNEHISITYGPPTYRPFFSSPEDPFLHHGNPDAINHHFYNTPTQQEPEYFYNKHFYDNNYQPDNRNYNPEYYPANENLYPQLPQVKYNDIFSKFYNKFDYHYPTFYNNYLNK